MISNSGVQVKLGAKLFGDADRAVDNVVAQVSNLPYRRASSLRGVRTI